MRLYLGECLEVMSQLREGEVDMVLADLPYGTTANKWDCLIDLSALWKAYLRVCRPGAALLFTASQPFTSLLVTSNLKLFRHEWIWIKNRGSNFANTVREPFKEHESVLMFSTGKWIYNKQMQERTGGGADRVKTPIDHNSRSPNYREFEGRSQVMLPELRGPSSWQKFNTQVGLHPTQKPVDLMRYLIRTYTNPGDVVLDNTMGSGTTGIASHREGRRFIGIEKNPEYFNAARERLAQTTSSLNSARPDTIGPERW